MLEKEAQRRNQHILKILAETARYKDNMRSLIQRTGFDPVEGRVVRTDRSPNITDRRGNKSVMSLPRNRIVEEPNEIEVYHII